MLLGRVKWFDDSKGFGFISPLEKGNGGDIFIHHENIQKHGYKTVSKNQLVRYEAKETANGLLATIIEPLEISQQEAMDNIVMDLLEDQILKISNDYYKETKMFLFGLLELYVVAKMQGEEQALIDFIAENKSIEQLQCLMENKTYSYKSKKSLEDYIKSLAEKSISHTEILKNIKVDF